MLVGALLASSLLACALGADFLASSKPIAMRWNGQLYVLANLRDPVELREQDNLSLRTLLQPARGDWLLEPLVPYGPFQTDLSLPSLPAPPGGQHYLGTDEIGRDVLARVIHGARVSLGVALLAVLMYVAIGILLGALAGYFRGPIDSVVSRATEVMLSFPTAFLVLAIVAIADRPSLHLLVVVIGLTRWPEVARLVRGEALRIRELDYVQSARALGATDARILLVHVIPNTLGPVLVAATLGVASVILLESGLSFLGLGAPPPLASWGEILTQAHRYASSPGAWWLAVFPGAAIFLAVSGFNLLGESLRGRLDPRLAFGSRNKEETVA
jgi:peptide/nickel transport system permease protein